VLPVVFGAVILRLFIVSILDPGSVGSHATFYTEAAAAMLSGGDPWLTGPPGAVFAGPPAMLVPFIPWVLVPPGLTRIAWVVVMAVLALDIIRRLRMPLYWMAFPPLFQAIAIGHIEVLVLWLLVAGRMLSGLAAFIKPYAILPLIAERRIASLALLGVAIVVTFPFLPWARFIDELPLIQHTITSQANGDSTFGAPLLMLVGILGLAALGLRRAIWLATPVLWPSAQFIYKVNSIPQLSPIIAVCWALPVPGATLVGVLIEAALMQVGRKRRLPAWIETGLGAPSLRSERTE
jgi:Protein of unknown function (DUF2029).